MRLTLLLWLLFPFCSIAQDQTRGLSNKASTVTLGPNVRAIIVGVSRYAHMPPSGQLQYAHKDALAFADFLKEHSGIEPSNITLFLDENAQHHAVEQMIYKTLFQEAQKGEQVIIYFAGHGDVDGNTDNAFLLTHDAPDPAEKAYYFGGALDVSRIQQFVQRATVAKGIKVLLITDACRSGHVVGENVSDKTLTSLLAEWENTGKLVSCAPNQLSEEGVQWGNGHGVFTYYLLKALMGEADIDEDKQVNLGEVYDFVRSNVRKDTKGQQSPQYKGNDDQVLITVDERLLDLARQDKYDNLKGLVASRSASDDKAPVHSKGVQALLNDFSEAIAEGRLLEPLKSTDKLDLNADFNEEASIQFIKNMSITENGIAVNYMSKHIKLMDNSLRQTVDVMVPFDNPKVIAASADGERYALGGGNGYLSLWEGEAQVKHIKTHKTAVSSIAFTANGHILSGDERGYLKLWDGNSPEAETVINIPSAITQLAIAPNGKWWAMATENGRVEILDATKQKRFINLETNLKTTHPISFSADAQWLLVGGEQNLLQVYKADGFKLSQTIKLNKKGVKGIFTLGHSNFALIAYEGQTLQVVDFIKGKPVGTFSIPEGDIAGVTVNASGQVFIGTKQHKLYKTKLTLPKPYAVDLYAGILATADTETSDKAKGSLAVALQNKAQQIITPFILGKTVTPSADEVTEAIRELDYAIGLYPNDPLLTEDMFIRKWFLEAYLIIVNNDVKHYNDAVALFMKILEKDNKSAFPHNGIALIRKKQMELAKAKESIAQALEIIPKWTEPRKNLGETFVKEGKFAEALKEFEKIKALSPEKTKGYLGAGNIYMEMGYYKLAETELQKAIKLDGNDPVVLANLANLRMAQGQLVQAENLLKNALQLNPTALLPYLQLAKLYELYYNRQDQNTELLDAAKALLELGIQYLPNEPDLQASLGYLMTEHHTHFQGQEKVIEEHFAKALALDPYNQLALEGRGLYAYLVANDAGKAKTFTMEFVEKLKQYPAPDIYLTKLALASKNYPSAAQSCLQAIKKNPARLAPYQLLWQLYLDTDSEKGLTELYLKGKEHLPQTPWFDYKYGLYYAGKKDTGKAKVYFTKALSIDPNFLYAGLAKAMQTNQRSKYSVKNLYPYDQTQQSFNGFTIVTKNGRQGVVDMAGRLIVPITYKHIDYKRNGYTVVQNTDGLYTITAPDGKVLNQQGYEEVTFLECGLISVKQNGKYGCIDKQTGAVKAPFKYARISNGNWTGKAAACCRINANDSAQQADFYYGDGSCGSCK
ncbi:caspase family protein [Limibacter armeniacum]|uniref:caspase family protein n=1 Tax=Limibacter armeniacum TaxID=466084 RepID=UPI002FE54355